MSASTAIAMASLIVALLALPTSYWVAVRQVRVGLAEQERQQQQTARFAVADRLDEFIKVFCAGVEVLTGIEPDEMRRDPALIDPDMPAIDAFVCKSGVLDRVAVAIDNLAAAGYAGWSQSSDEVIKLQSIRNQIALGTGQTRYVTLGVISLLSQPDLQIELRTR